jgi:hypothetical protein
MNREPLPDDELDALLFAAHTELVNHHTAKHTRPAVKRVSWYEVVWAGFCSVAAVAFTILVTTLLVTPAVYVSTATTGSSFRVIVSNKVTDGASKMREDLSPAYLTSATSNDCNRNGCILNGTILKTGDDIIAICLTIGERTTNGEDDTTEDDHNVGLANSTLWYGIRWDDGRFGYISTVWLEPQYRSLDLPDCTAIEKP